VTRLLDLELGTYPVSSEWTQSITWALKSRELSYRVSKTVGNTQSTRGSAPHCLGGVEGAVEGKAWEGRQAAPRSRDVPNWEWGPQS
jgi:hypothetical protein